VESSSQSPAFRTLPSPWNSSDIIEASDFTVENHRHFFNTIQNAKGFQFDIKVVEDIFSRTQGYAGFEGLFASKCLEWTINVKNHILEFKTYDYRITDYVRSQTIEKLEAITHIRDRLSPNNHTATPLMNNAKKLLEDFLYSGSLTKFQIEDDDALIYLRGLGIIKQKEDSDEYIFTSNLLFDLLSDVYYPIGDRGSIAGFGTIGDPEDFLQRVISSFKHIRRTIYDSLASNAHSIAEAMIQGELYALLRTAIPYPKYRLYRETKTIKASEKRCDFWVTNGYDYGIETKVGLATETEIINGAKQAIDYTKHRPNTRAMFLLNFLPTESQSNEPNLTFAEARNVHFEVVHVLYNVKDKTAIIHRCDHRDIVVSFASS